jgi:catechol 2,3-dioxygenase-like lactoylglutathione lyase family enzyme/ketosteroid isomerase-like protein
MIDRIDHFDLVVRDLDATCAFYARALGVEVVTFGQGRRALGFGAQKINLRQAGQEASALGAGRPTPAPGHFCLITERPLAEWIERLRGAGVALDPGPVTRTGALGPIESVYFHDPDGHHVEVSRYAEKPPAGGDPIAPLREWLLAFAARVRAVDYAGGRAMCAPDMLAFGTYAGMVEDIDAIMDAQWRHIWPTIREFSIRAEEARGGISGDTAWVAAPWDSLGTRADGNTYPRPGRLTIVFTRQEGRWLARHTHLSLVPEPRRTTGTETP